MLKKIIYLSITCLTIGALSPVLTGCGQTGPLYLPKEPPPAQVEMNTVSPSTNSYDARH